MKKYIVMSVVFSFISIAQAHYTQIYAVREAQNVLDAADENTLVLFDVDETLIVPLDKIHWPKFFKNEPGKSLKDAVWDHVVTQDEKERIWTAPLFQSERTLVEPHLADLIKKLQQRKIKTLGLTRMRSGKHGGINYLREYRFTQLFKFGIDFRSTYAQTIVFTECEKWNNEEHPMIYKGIIFSSEMPKGPVLGAFLDKVDWKINKVIFFDDAFDNILSVEQEMKKRNIEYHGYYYCAVATMPVELDCEVAKFQLEYLAEHEVWLGENDARRMIDANVLLQDQSCAAAVAV